MKLVWIRIWGWLEEVNLELQEENGRNDKEKLKNHMLQIMRKFHIIMKKFPMTMQIEQEKKNVTISQEG